MNEDNIEQLAREFVRAVDNFDDHAAHNAFEQLVKGMETPILEDAFEEAIFTVRETITADSHIRGGALAPLSTAEFEVIGAIEEDLFHSPCKRLPIILSK